MTRKNELKLKKDLYGGESGYLRQLCEVARRAGKVFKLGAYIMPCLFGHKWNVCKCERCGKTRDEQHDWDDCILKSMRPLFAVAMIFCLVVLSGCTKASKIYDEAVVFFKDGDFASAKELFATLPEDNLGADLYLNAIAAVEAYEDEKWLEAARAFDSLDQLVQDQYDTIYVEMPTIGFDLFDPLRAKISSINEALGLPPITYDSRVTGNRKTSMQILFHDSLYFYYIEQYALGNDLGVLAEHPLMKPNERPEERNSELYDTLFIEGWINCRDRQLEEAIANSPELKAFYSKTDSSVSPIAVTGTGLYISRANAAQFASDKNHPLYFGISPFCYASAPEEVRYVLNLEEKYANFGTYDDNAKGYTTTTTLTLKDVVTGEILFSEGYTVNPAGQKMGGGDVYGRFTLENTEFYSDILPLLIERFDVLR